MGQPGRVIRDATPDDRHHLANLIHFQTFVHRHLDWRAPLDWLGSQPYLIMEQDGHLDAVLACPPAPPEVAWLRLFGVDNRAEVQAAWLALWSAARQALAEGGCLNAFALSLQPWMAELLHNSGFAHVNDVILLVWDSGDMRALPRPQPSLVRGMLREDLDAVQQVDDGAFSPEWRNSRSDLEYAYLQSAAATVVVEQGQIVGYQISTAGPVGGHLARLAVLPHRQGRGLGYALVYHVLDEFSRRGVSHITVNTQSNNHASQALYHKCGFWDANECYPVYQMGSL